MLPSKRQTNPFISSSTRTSISRTSFGSLLQSISQSDNEAELELDDSQFVTPTRNNFAEKNKRINQYNYKKNTSSPFQSNSEQSSLEFQQRRSKNDSQQQVNYNFFKTDSDSSNVASNQPSRKIKNRKWGTDGYNSSFQQSSSKKLLQLSSDSQIKNNKGSTIQIISNKKQNYRSQVPNQVQVNTFYWQKQSNLYSQMDQKVKYKPLFVENSWQRERNTKQIKLPNQQANYGDTFSNDFESNSIKEKKTTQEKSVFINKNTHNDSFSNRKNSLYKQKDQEIRPLETKPNYIFTQQPKRRNFIPQQQKRNYVVSQYRNRFEPVQVKKQNLNNRIKSDSLKQLDSSRVSSVNLEQRIDLNIPHQENRKYTITQQQKQQLSFSSDQQVQFDFQKSNHDNQHEIPDRNKENRQLPQLNRLNNNWGAKFYSNKRNEKNTILKVDNFDNENDFSDQNNLSGQSKFNKQKVMQSNQSNPTCRSIQTNFSHRSKRLFTMTQRPPQLIRQYYITIIQYCSHQIGLACYNNTTGQIYLCQLIQNMTYYKTISTISAFPPLEIIYSKTLQNTILIKMLKQNFRRSAFKPINRKHFNEKMGINLFLQTSNIDNLNINSKFLALACLNALVLYIEQNLQIKLKTNTLNIRQHKLDELLIIQSTTIAELEIFYNVQTLKNKRCLIQNFNCITYGGSRLLKANLLQPSTDLKTITERQKLVQKLLQNPSLLQLLDKQLYKHKYYEPITCKFIQNPKQENINSLKSYLSTIYALSNQCVSLQNLYRVLEQNNVFELPLFEKLDEKLKSQKLKTIKQTIEQNFDEDMLKNYQQFKKKRQKFLFLFKVQKIQDPFADLARIGYKSIVDTIVNYFNQIKAKIKVQIRLMYDDQTGYYFRITDSGLDLQNIAQTLEENLVQISTKGRVVQFSTQILSSLNNRIKSTQKILIFQTQTLLKKIILKIQQNILILFEINYTLSTIDMVMSFAKFVLKYSQFTKFVKPKFIKGSDILKIQKLKPIWLINQNNYPKIQVEQIDLPYKNKQNNTIMIEKSINSIKQLNYLSSLAYCVILSQIGCFIPAQNVQISPFQSMHSKIHVKQKTYMRMSRFQLNLLRIQNIFQNCFAKNYGRALILMDQIVKGSQHEQQCALSLSFIKRIQQVRGFIILLTSDKMLTHYVKQYAQFKKVIIFTNKNLQKEKQALQRIIIQSIQIMRKNNVNNKFIQSFQQIKVFSDYLGEKIDQNQNQKEGEQHNIES